MLKLSKGFLIFMILFWHGYERVVIVTFISLIESKTT